MTTLDPSAVPFPLSSLDSKPDAMLRDRPFNLSTIRHIRYRARNLPRFLSRASFHGSQGLTTDEVVMSDYNYKFTDSSRLVPDLFSMDRSVAASLLKQHLFWETEPKLSTTLIS